MGDADTSKLNNVSIPCIDRVCIFTDNISNKSVFRSGHFSLNSKCNFMNVHFQKAEDLNLLVILLGKNKRLLWE